MIYQPRPVQRIPYVFILGMALYIGIAIDTVLIMSLIAVAMLVNGDVQTTSNIFEFLPKLTKWLCP